MRQVTLVRGGYQVGRIRRLYVVASTAFWMVAVIVLVNQWFGLRGSLTDRLSDLPDPGGAAAAMAARQVWVAFFLFALGYAAVSLGVAALALAVRWRTRAEARTSGVTRAVWS